MADKLAPAARRFVLDTLLMRCFSFGLNQLIVRFANPATIGVAAIQLELLLSSLLFLSREAIRLALLRANITDKLKLKQFVNISWIPAFILLVVLAVCLPLRPTWSKQVPSIVVQMYVTGALLEACGEPLYNLYNKRVLLRPRVLAESFAITIRSLCSCILVVYLKYDVLGYGISQLLHGGVYLCTLCACSQWLSDSSASSSASQATPTSISDFLPSYLPLLKESSSRAVARRTYIDVAIHQVGADNVSTLFATGPFFIFKHILTEADKIIMSSIRPNYDQGVYAILNNYVSLVARIIFYPVEESSRIAFAQSSMRIRSDKSSAEARLALVGQSKLLYRLVLALSIFGILFPLFGPHYARLLVNLLLSAQWRSEETVRTLVAFCPYVFVLGINGVVESYIHTIIPSSFFNMVNLNLFNSSLVFAIVVFPLISWCGTCGVVYASIVSMIVRILLNYQLIVKSFRDPSAVFERSVDPLEDLAVITITKDFFLPRFDSLPANAYLALVSCFSICFASSIRYSNSAMLLQNAAEHVCIGLICLVYFLFCVWQTYESEMDAIVSSLGLKGKLSSAKLD